MMRHMCWISLFIVQLHPCLPEDDQTLLCQHRNNAEKLCAFCQSCCKKAALLCPQTGVFMRKAEYVQKNQETGSVPKSVILHPCLHLVVIRDLEKAKRCIQPIGPILHYNQSQCQLVLRLKD
eukprot:scaffold3827_cov179-Cylindrotheca_fusiformis.AAC.21